ncbi:hypothetical protein LCGC14_2915410 [marine sediment metagenome]|uniref:Uncharacterized protein n=1 Tax=marine sediment metagenome TaxID=412755 RepID=A0A0F9AGI4_9ZZZZ
MKNKKVEIKSSEPNIIIIDGEEYILERESSKKIDGIEHSDKLIFKPYKKDEFIKDLNLIIEALSKKTTKKAAPIIFDVEMEIVVDKKIISHVKKLYVRRLALRIQKNKPIKKQKGCLGFKIGNDAYVQLIE